MCCPDDKINPTNAVMATLCLLLNIFLPGVGTILNGCLGVHFVEGLCYGLLQILLTPLLIGWIWSIVYGIKIVQLSGKGGEMYHDHLH